MPTLSSFGEDARGPPLRVNNQGNQVVRLVAGATAGTLDTQPLTGPFDLPVALRHVSR